MIEGKKISAMLPKSWKKSFSNGISVPAKMRFCDEWNHDIFCDRCNDEINENRQFEVNLNLLKRQAPNQLGYMLP